MKSTKGFSQFSKIYRDLKGIYEFVKPHKKYLFISIFFTILTSSTGLFIPFLTGRGIDFLVVLKNFQRARKYFILIIVFFLFQGVVNYIKVLLFEKFRYLISRDLREVLFKKLLYASIEASTSFKSGDISSRFSNDITEIEYLLRVFILQIAGSFITFFGALTIMFFIDAKLTIVALSSILMALLVLFLMARKFKYYSKRILNKVGEISNRIQEVVVNFKIVKAYLLEDREFLNLKKLNEEEFSYQIDRARYLAFFSTVNQTLIWLGLILIIGFGFYHMSLKDISTGELVSFILYTFKLIIPAVGIAMSFSYLNQGIAAWERLEFLLKLEGENSRGNFLKEKLDGEIEFKDVSFSYDNVKVLSGVSFKIMPGEKVAIVGLTGGGKSTILNLIVRFYDGYKGEILIDGVDIRKYDLSFLRGSITYIPQKFYLFSGDLAKNIGDFGEEEKKLLEIFNLEGIGSEREIKFLGEDVSGGEAQRISILRGLLRGGDIFLIDEITSSLDSLTEERVFSVLREFLKEKTAIIVAHRLSSIGWVDRILVLDGGVIKEEGTHEELIKLRGLYYHFYLLQKLEGENY